ncbi:nickel/cobalt homeostasis protein RcnB [Klebsiella pneumoniae subsp. ozaenae]|uniref:Nickel/cobalt homeostasis protein RcnB n=1 Tax=Klebsiella pneumoniae subsp. ozaenae TaxID=574 RepID=A0A377Z9W1_KLEPO|nr:nickel/cobalt homeostasis protein RcnB [Klebsiella pneumoniae subsp. ozaenae]
MRKTKMMLLGVLLATAGASWTATAAGIDQYALKEFTADFTQFHIGDTVPAMYLTPEYNIKQWQQRNPACAGRRQPLDLYGPVTTC